MSLEGAIGLAPSFDTCGYFARDGETFARVGDVLLGQDPASLPESPRLLLAAGAFAALDSDVRGALAPVVKRIEDLLGKAQIVEPAPEGVETLVRTFRILQGREAWQLHGTLIERYRLPLGPGVAERFAFAKSVTDDQVAEAEAIRARFRGRFAGFLGRDGVLILPSMPDIAPLLGRARPRSMPIATARCISSACPGCRACRRSRCPWRAVSAHHSGCRSGLGPVIRRPVPEHDQRAIRSRGPQPAQHLDRVFTVGAPIGPDAHRAFVVEIQPVERDPRG